MKSILRIWAHYEIKDLQTFEEVKNFFNEQTLMDLNWLFVSTSGVHGNCHSISDLYSPETDDKEESWDQHIISNNGIYDVDNIGCVLIDSVVVPVKLKD